MSVSKKQAERAIELMEKARGHLNRASEAVNSAQVIVTGTDSAKSLELADNEALEAIQHLCDAEDEACRAAGLPTGIPGEDDC